MWGKKISEFLPDKGVSETVTIKDLLNGKVHASGIIKKNRGYLIFLVVLAIIYINNNFVVESLMKEQLKLSKEIQELKYEAISTSSELMKKTKQSEVIRKVQENNLGLEVLTTPPKTIIVGKNEQ
jgi:hypothetical protein